MKSTTIVSGPNTSLPCTAVNIFDFGCVSIHNPTRPIIFRRNFRSIEGGDEKDFIEGVSDENAIHRHYGFIQFDDSGIVTKTVNILLPVGKEENDVGAVLSDDEKREKELSAVFENGEDVIFVKFIERLLMRG